MALRSIELFAGGGGLALGLKRVGVRTVCYVEREAYAAAVLAARMEDGCMDPAPIWSDVCSFDGRRWRGVDVVAGGFPCQDISRAGKRAGIQAGRKSGLWHQFARIVCEVRPRIVFVENVANLNRHGLETVLGDLASLGFDAEWTVLEAANAGAPHRRARTFILAYSGGVSNVKQEDKVPAGRYPASNGNWWMSEPGVGRVADGVANRVDRLRTLGNGVVPHQAEVAWKHLWGRIAQ